MGTTVAGFGLSSNEESAVNTARQQVKEAEEGLRDARKTLNATPRSENLAATNAVKAWERTLAQAQARLSTAEANLARAKQR